MGMLLARLQQSLASPWQSPLPAGADKQGPQALCWSPWAPLPSLVCSLLPAYCLSTLDVY